MILGRTILIVLVNTTAIRTKKGVCGGGVRQGLEPMNGTFFL